MPISQTMSRNNHFTLIEMIAVIAIISIATGLAVSSLREESPVRKLQRTGLEFETFCAGVRYQAMEHGDERIVLLEPEKHRLIMQSPEDLTAEEEPEIRTSWSFPEDFSLALQEDSGTEQIELFRFFPDGGAAGLRNLTFQYHNMERAYQISPLTGRLLLQEEEE